MTASSNPRRGARGKTGQPTKLDDAIASKVVASLRGGNYLETAAAQAGISVMTLRTWIKHGVRQMAAGVNDAFTKFARDVEQAQADAEAEDVANLRRHSKKDWRAAAFRLERRRPERWGDPSREIKARASVESDDDGVRVKLTIEQARAGARGEDWTDDDDKEG